MHNIEKYNEKIFENIKHIDEFGNEYWEARELQLMLGYKEWRLFLSIIEKAQIACLKSNNIINSHFVVYPKIVSAGVTTKQIIDYRLSRYACYLIVQNANPKFDAVSLGQTYFAIQTRKQELSKIEYNNLTEEQKRIYRRNQARSGNYNLNQTAVKSGVKDLARFHNAGYKGLYNGETADEFLKEKNLDIEKIF